VSSPFYGQLSSPSFLHHLCKAWRSVQSSIASPGICTAFAVPPPRWLRAGIDVRTVQAWLGHESLATTQKIPEAVERDGEAAGEDADAVLRAKILTPAMARNSVLWIPLASVIWGMQESA
jgi:hypothetical protein